MGYEDKLLKMFFEHDRWEAAIAKGVEKGINMGQLYQLAKPEVRVSLLESIRSGKYRIMPPHTAEIPKPTGGFRTVYINEGIDRIFLSIVNDMLFELMPEMLHPNCKSYQKNISCDKVVREFVNEINHTEGEVVGFKSDLSKYFDSVPLRYIDEAFDKVEAKHGHSAIIDIVRDYYHNDMYFDKDMNLCEKYQSLKQGCAVASWLSDVILYHIDEKLASMKGKTRRYSDDIIYTGTDYQEAMDILKEELERMEMHLNPKKVEYIRRDRWVEFLGFSIKGNEVSLGELRIKGFQKAIESRTIKADDTTPKKAVNKVMDYLYKGDYPWATQVLRVMNVEKDILQLDKFVMDCLRAVNTKKTKLGGLGYVRQGDCCIARGKGRNVKANRKKAGGKIDGYLTIGCMKKALLTSRDLFNTLAASV